MGTIRSDRAEPREAIRLGTEELQGLGVPYREDVPQEIYDLMDLYPQPAQRRLSLPYVPLPYQGPTRGDGRH